MLKPLWIYARLLETSSGWKFRIWSTCKLNLCLATKRYANSRARTIAIQIRIGINSIVAAINKNKCKKYVIKCRNWPCSKAIAIVVVIVHIGYY